MADATHIRGDTFTVLGRFHNGDYTGWTGRSQVRTLDTDELLSELEFTWIDPVAGSFVVQTNATDNWPAEKDVVFDVQATSATGVKISSKLVRIEVLRDVTKDG